MAMLNRLQVGLRPTGTSASVPNHPAARLMYYLDCMCSVLKLDDNADINRMRRYSQYYTLTHMDKNVLIHLCYLLKPDVLLNKCIFQNDAMCGNSGNEFFDLETVRDTLVFAGSVMVGGQQKRVTKIMAFKMSWLSNNWTNPMKELISRQEQERRQTLARSQSGQTCVIL